MVSQKIEFLEFSFLRILRIFEANLGCLDELEGWLEWIAISFSTFYRS